jgi:hypothetical protein
MFSFHLIKKYASSVTTGWLFEKQFSQRQLTVSIY